MLKVKASAARDTYVNEPHCETDLASYATWIGNGAMLSKMVKGL